MIHAPLVHHLLESPHTLGSLAQNVTDLAIVVSISYSALYGVSDFGVAAVCPHVNTDSRPALSDGITTVMNTAFRKFYAKFMFHALNVVHPGGDVNRKVSLICGPLPDNHQRQDTAYGSHGLTETILVHGSINSCPKIAYHGEKGHESFRSCPFLLALSGMPDPPLATPAALTIFDWMRP